MSSIPTDRRTFKPRRRRDSVLKALRLWRAGGGGGGQMVNMGGRFESGELSRGDDGRKRLQRGRFHVAKRVCGRQCDVNQYRM